MRDKRPFVPRDKPKSWVISVILRLSFFGFVLFGFLLDHWGLMQYFSTVYSSLLIGLLVGDFVVSAIYARRWKAGYYNNLTSTPWKEQIW